MVQSSEMTGKTFCPVGDLTSAKAEEEIWLRARVHTSRWVQYVAEIGLVVVTSS